MDRSKIIVKTSIIAIITNILLVIFKAIVGVFANSIAIILDAVNNLSDVISAVVTIIGTKLAGKAPDRDHPYGHGRIEYVTSIIISMLILAAGVAALKESVEKIINPVTTNYSGASLLIVGVAIFVKFFLGRYVKNTGKKIDSQSLIASGTDAFFDAVVSTSTFIAAVVNIIWKVQLEGFLGILISALIIKSGIEILKEALNTMIGVRADGELSKKIRDRINKFEGVEGTYDLILHSYGPSKIIGAANIEVNENMLAREIHGLTKKIEVEIYKEFGIVLTIGIYASNDTDEDVMNIKKDLEEIIKKYPNIIQLHGFYVEKEDMYVTFDIIIDFKEKNPKELKEKILTEIKELHPEYSYFVVVDADICD